MADRERRQHPRILLNERCWCEAEDVSVFAPMGNLSEGGLFVRTQLPLPVGTEATLRFHLGDDGPEHEVKAVVVWGTSGAAASPSGMGLRFTSAAPEAVAGIRILVSRLSGQEI
ncbi:MAG TPA: PilZ domain-containing protein [Myxococcales bacterium]|nr:PilZ domain-containing protein [Myxococcales bacterium]